MAIGMNNKVIPSGSDVFIFVLFFARGDGCSKWGCERHDLVLFLFGETGARAVIWPVFRCVCGQWNHDSTRILGHLPTGTGVLLTNTSGSRLFSYDIQLLSQRRAPLRSGSSTCKH
jgi:hypothetical protein